MPFYKLLVYFLRLYFRYCYILMSRHRKRQASLVGGKGFFSDLQINFEITFWGINTASWSSGRAKCPIAEIQD